ncbi:MAG: helix-turn-helix transcriptional regulator [Lachnospiraceae bacterium]|nr:helix-turn-helix transcriptional regulator [Lachnospiraceae bacterium]
MSEKNLAQYLKELRKSYNYSQEFVASQLYITRQTYSHYETGRITPPVNSLYNLSKLYKIPIENFLEFTTTNCLNSSHEKSDSISEILADDDLSGFLNHISTPENSKKFKSLERQEKLFLYYYQLLDARDQEDILSFMRVKCHNRTNAKSTKSSLTNSILKQKEDC